jgi:hypothetical protein
MKISFIAAMIVSAAMVPSSFAQLTIKNPQHLDVPEAKAQALINTVRRVVAENFPLSDRAKNAKFPITLVLGQKEEHYSADDKKGMYTLYLEHWDETKYTVAITTLAIQHFIIRDRLKQMVPEILRRSAQMAPVPVTQLQGKREALQRVPNRPLVGCLGAATDAAARSVSCSPSLP